MTTVQITQKVTLDNLGWPVEQIKGRWFVNWIRRLMHGRRRVEVVFRGELPGDRGCPPCLWEWMSRSCTFDYYRCNRCQATFGIDVEAMGLRGGYPSGRKLEDGDG